MGRNNGTFSYALPQTPVRDKDTGFFKSGTNATEWKPGCECHIETFIPAKQRLGEDGQMFSYTYDVLIPRYFNGELSIGTLIQVTGEYGNTDEFTILGVDNFNRKYIEIWG